MSLIAVLLTRRGYDVDVLTCRASWFFDAEVKAAGVPLRRLGPGSCCARSRFGGPSASGDAFRLRGAATDVVALDRGLRWRDPPSVCVTSSLRSRTCRAPSGRDAPAKVLEPGSRTIAPESLSRRQSARSQAPKEPVVTGHADDGVDE